MRALVTGATGYLGLDLARRLLRDGWDVDVLVRPSSDVTSIGKLLGSDRIIVHDGTMGGMLESVARAMPTTVFHLGSLFLAQHRTEDVSRLVESNLHFPTQLAEAMAVHGVGALVNTGTVWQHYDNHDFDPVNLYAATKQAFADIIRSYAASGAFRAVNLELFDTYGPGDTRPKLFSLLRKAAASGETLAMSPGEQQIDLVYVDDVTSAYVAAAKRLAEPGHPPVETFSVCTGAPVRLRDLVLLWSKVTGRKLDVQWGARPYRPREVMKPWDRGLTVPGWRAQMPLEQGIRLMEGLT